MNCYYNQYCRNETIVWIFSQVTFSGFALRATPDKVKNYDFTLRRLDSEALRRLQRWGKVCFIEQECRCRLVVGDGIYSLTTIEIFNYGSRACIYKYHDEIVFH